MTGHGRWNDGERGEEDEIGTSRTKRGRHDETGRNSNITRTRDGEHGDGNRRSRVGFTAEDPPEKTGSGRGRMRR